MVEWRKKGVELSRSCQVHLRVIGAASPANALVRIR
jgi:hypothetical protein